MARYTTTISTPMRPADAFAALADFTTVADWDPGVTRADRVDHGDLGVGSAFDVDVALGPRVATFRYVITDYDEPERVVLRGEWRGLVSTDTITVHPAGSDASTVTYDAVLDLPGLLRWADPLLWLGFRRVGDRAAHGLGEHLTSVSA